MSEITYELNYNYITYVNPVGARQQYAPELSVLGGVIGDIAALHLDGGALQRVAVLVSHEPVRAAVSLRQVLYQRLRIIQTVGVNYFDALCTKNPSNRTFMTGVTLRLVVML